MYVACEVLLADRAQENNKKKELIHITYSYNIFI
jgi:hypothetical protein